MEEEIEQINVEPELPFNPFGDCPDNCEGDTEEKINIGTDAENLFTFTKSTKRSTQNNTKRCIYCDKIYNKKYLATHIRVRQ